VLRPRTISSPSSGKPVITVPGGNRSGAGAKLRWRFEVAKTDRNRQMVSARSASAVPQAAKGERAAALCPPQHTVTTKSPLAARGGTRARPRGQDLVRERDARRKSTPVIYDDEQRSYRAKSCPLTRSADKGSVLSWIRSTSRLRPWPGLRRRPLPALLHLLSNVPHCLRRCVALETGRRSQRGPREFHHGLLVFGRELRY
jgi:hypothetical protein